MVLLGVCRNLLGEGSANQPIAIDAFFDAHVDNANRRQGDYVTTGVDPFGEGEFGDALLCCRIQELNGRGGTP